MAVAGAVGVAVVGAGVVGAGAGCAGVATNAPARVTETQPFLGLSTSQPTPSAYARADASAVSCNDTSLSAMV